MFDAYCDHITTEDPNMLVPWYLMSSYAYYIDSDPILSDGMYDELSKRLLKSWDDIVHQHKNHITKGDLEAGSFLGEYPSRILGALYSVKRDNPQPPETMGSLEKFL
jgi:hypothetical protein